MKLAFGAIQQYAGEASFLWLGLPSILIRYENRDFRRRCSNLKNLKTPAFRFRVKGNHFEEEAVRKRWHNENRMISLTEVSFNTNLK